MKSLLKSKEKNNNKKKVQGNARKKKNPIFTLYMVELVL